MFSSLIIFLLFSKYKTILENDNRRTSSKCVITFPKLREIIESANEIYVNLGTPYMKVNKIYCDAKAWIEKFHHLLFNCGIIVDNQSSLPDVQKHKVSLDLANQAIEAASNDLSVELEEVIKLKSLVSKSQDWFDRAIEFAPKRNKRIVKGKKELPTKKRSVQEVIDLINTAPKIPMDTTEDLGRLRILLSDVQSWRLQAQLDLQEITKAFDSLGEERIRYYGEPKDFLKDNEEPPNVEKDSTTLTVGGNDPATQSIQCDNQANLHTKVSENGSKSPSKPPSGSTGKDVYKMVSNLIKSAETIPINSFEEQVSAHLGVISKWCKKVAILIASHNDVYTNKRWKKDLDTFISEGENLKFPNMFEDIMTGNDTDEKKLLSNVERSLSTFILHDVQRLEILRTHRNKFYKWCEEVNKAYTEGDKKVTLDVLRTLAEESSIYPQSKLSLPPFSHHCLIQFEYLIPSFSSTGAETVKQVRKDASNAAEWAKSVGEMMSLGKKFSLSEAKSKLDLATRLKFTCPEYKELKSSYQSAKTWAKKVKKSGLNEGSAQIYKIKELIREHDSFHISMPEEIEALKSAMCSYCICRRPYEGFMIGCDDCEEWYHGHCIGVSQAQGNRIDKYLCIRCCVKKVYKHSSSIVASVVRKWSDPRDLMKARSMDSQKHQRKIREKKREIGKWKEELQTNVAKLRDLKAEEIRHLSLTSNLHQTSAENQTSSPLSPKITEVNGNIVKATTALEQCNRRLEELAALTKERKSVQEKEDVMMEFFRYWCLQIRSKVLTPDSETQAEKSRPTPSLDCKTATELLSNPMSDIMALASNYGLNEFPDFNIVQNSFECISWCHLALSILKRRPKHEEITALVELSSQVKLPEVKSLGMMRSMLSRTAAWQTKVTKALGPKDGDKKQCNMAVLNELRVGLNGIPLLTSQESSLLNAIGGQCTVTTGVDLSDVSSHAPDPLKLWPPFGLSNSREALEAYGQFSLSLKLENMPVPVHPSKMVKKTSSTVMVRPKVWPSNPTNSNGKAMPTPKANGAMKPISTALSIPNGNGSVTQKSNHVIASQNTNRSIPQTKDSNQAIDQKSKPSAKLQDDKGSVLNTNQVAAEAVRAALSVNPQVFVDSIPKATNSDNANTTVKNIPNLDAKHLINAKEAVEVAVKAALASTEMFKPMVAKLPINNGKQLTTTNIPQKVTPQRPSPQVVSKPFQGKPNLTKVGTIQSNQKVALSKTPMVRTAEPGPGGNNQPSLLNNNLKTPQTIKTAMNHSSKQPVNVNITKGNKLSTTQAVPAKVVKYTNSTAVVPPTKGVPTTQTVHVPQSISAKPASHANNSNSKHPGVILKQPTQPKPPNQTTAPQVNSPQKSSVLLKKFG